MDAFDRERVEVFEDKAGEWRWHVVGGNNEVTDASESYPTRGAALRGYADHRDIVLRNPIVVVKG